jgi:hypothetical protein
LSTRKIAEHVVGYYLPQVRPYVAHRGTNEAPGDDRRLDQISSRGQKPSVTIEAVFRLHLQAGGAVSAALARRNAPKAYDACLDEVECNFARYPLRRLQVIGGTPHEFLYRQPTWGESVSVRRLRTEGSVEFLPGAAAELLRLAPLIRPLVEHHWVRQVSVLNGLDLESGALHHHLFGQARTAFPKRLAADLLEIQRGRCFYCSKPVSGKRVEIDHVLPWSRLPNDAVENLVAADSRCNNDKRDRLLVRRHVERWLEHLQGCGHHLREVAVRVKLDSAPERARALMRAGYAFLPEGTPLWLARGEVREEPLGPIRSLLATET